MWPIILATLIKMLIMLGFAIALAAVLTWMERRQSAMMQDRVGPERANLRKPRPGSKLGRWRFWGLVHPLADSLKLAAKEDFVPPKSHRSLYALAPLLALAPVLLVFAVIPFGPPVMLDQWDTALPAAAGEVAQLAAASKLAGEYHYLQVANLDIGILFVFALASLSVYGAALAGWSSYNSYGLLGGMRASAQMFSYEITMGMAVMGAFIVYGTLEPMAVVEKQATIGNWGVVSQPLGFLLFFFAAIAETKRAPFDLPEGESEIVGYFVEYSGARFMMFYLGEFVEIVFAGAMVATLFFGGWHLPGLHDHGLYISGALATVVGLLLVLAGVLLLIKFRAIALAVLVFLLAAGCLGFAAYLGHGGLSELFIPLAHGTVTVLRVLTFMGKVFVLCFLQLTIRWSVPRMRYDQLMKLGWKGLLPASIINVVITAAVVWLTTKVVPMP